jgi:hypothetical protein
MNKKHFTTVSAGELLSVTGAKHKNENFIVLTIRLDPENFESKNIGLKPEQAVRLLRDLQNMVNHSPIMAEAYQNAPDSFESYKKIVLEEPVPKKKARKKP